MKMPEVYRYMTADECAECVDYWRYLSDGNSLYTKLYDFLGKATTPTPLGPTEQLSAPRIWSTGTIQAPTGGAH